MYLEISQGSKKQIQGLECNIPPVGYIFDIATKKVEHIGIYSRSEDIEEQYWERIPMPIWYDAVLKEEEQYNKRKKDSDEDFYDENYENYKRQEWQRRLSGFWFMNKGEPVYLVGAHYLYMQHIQIDIGYPKYRIPDLEYFYFLQYVIQDPNCLGMLEITKRRFGKCFAKNTPIRMYDGTVKNVQDIVEDDLIMGNDSTSRKAFGITKGNEIMYKISPKKGDAFECNKSHILSLIWNGASTHSKFGWVKNSIVNISVFEYLKLKDWEKNHLCLYRSGWGANFKENKHVISPYMLGVYIGDGCKTYGHITTADKEILEEVECCASSMGLKCVKTIGEKNNITYRLSQKGYKINDNGYGSLKNWSTNPYRNELRKLNVLKNKHIPTEYLIDSEKNRLELLAGLIDTDGYLMRVKGKTHGYEITQKIKRIADNIVELARSLGFFVSIKNKIAQMVRHDGTIYKCEVYRVSIFGSVNIIPCKVNRKKATQLERRSNCIRTGFNITEIGYGEYFGFAVDGNHLFLLQDGMVVHNTFRGGVFVLDYPTRTKMTNGAIQSKTGSDAKKVFAKAVVDPFKKLPRFFKPEYDLSGGVTPKSELRFQNTNVRGKKAEENLEKDELGSLIDYGSADTLAYDGQKIHRKLDDEFAKTLECNIYDRHDVTRYCLMDDEGKIIGKVLYTSTVERLDTDREGVQDGARKLWNDSDQLHKGENGRTPTGLYRFFMAADRAKNFDKYGFSDIEKTRKEILADRKTVEHNPRALSARTRKEPLTIEEAFGIDSDECSFNVSNISKQRAEIGENKCPLRKVMFYKNGDEVTWKDDKNGLWEILEFPKDGKENEHNYTNKFKQPVNTKDYLISIDSYSGYQGGRKYGSTACGLVFDRNKRKFVAMYYGRPQYKEQLHEQIMFASEFYSCKNYYEKTADDYEGYFRTRYMSNYMGRYPLTSIEPTRRDNTERLYGFPITPYAMTKQLDEMILYIENECNKIWFDKILEQCLLFDPYDRTKSDCVVSAMIALVSAMEIVKVYSTNQHILIKSYGEQRSSNLNPAHADY